MSRINSFITNSKQFLIVGFSMLLFTASPSLAQNQQQSDPLQLFKAVGIDSTQEAKMRQLANEFETSVSQKNDEARVLFNQLRDETLQPTPDAQKFLHCQEQINKIHSEVSMLHAKFILNLRNVLNESQKEKLVAMMKQNLQQQQGAQAPAGK